MAMHRLAEKTWLDATKARAVPDGDPEAAHLLGPAGYEIPEAEAERLGLTAQAAPQADVAEERDAAEDAKAVKPAANKAVEPAADKARGERK